MSEVATNLTPVKSKRRLYIFTFRQFYVANGIRHTYTRHIAANDLVEASKAWSFAPEVQRLEKDTILLELGIKRDLA